MVPPTLADMTSELLIPRIGTAIERGGYTLQQVGAERWRVRNRTGRICAYLDGVDEAWLERAAIVRVQRMTRDRTGFVTIAEANSLDEALSVLRWESAA